jgi:hypothetical protein
MIHALYGRSGYTGSVSKRVFKYASLLIHHNHFLLLHQHRRERERS